MTENSSMHRSLFLFLLGLISLNTWSQSSIANTERESFIKQAAKEQNLNYFQYPSINKYDVTYLKLDLNVEANNRNFDGTSLTVAKVTAAMNSFIIELRDNMIVDSIFFNGTKIAFQRGIDHIFIPLNPIIPVGATINVLTYYRGLTSSSGVFAGTVSGIGLNYTATLSESYQAREWFPAKQVLSDKIDSADIWITSSAINKSGSNGLLKAIVDKPGNKKQYQWKTTYPMAYYHPSIAVGNYMDYSIYAKPAEMAPDSILIQTYLVDNQAYFNSNKTNIDRTIPFLEKMSELYGLYPFSKEKYGHSHAAIGGGMEHQTMSTMNSFGNILVAHELAHQWWGNNVTCATWNHIWLNEGFASYSEYLMIEKLPAQFATNAAAYMLGVHTDVLSSNTGSVFVPEASIFDENRIFSTRFSYNKGSAIIHTLRFELQDDAVFFQVLKNYQQQYRNKVATADDFRQVAETTSGKDLSAFFTQWYYGQGYPTFNVDFSKQGDSIVLFVNQTVSAPAVTPFFKGLYEMSIVTNLGDTTVKIQLDQNNSFFKFRSNRIPFGVVVDPNNWVLNKTGSITTPVIEPVEPGNEIQVYPNPSNGVITSRFPANTYKRIQVIDLTGRTMKNFSLSASDNTKQLELSLPSGMYFIRFFGNGKSVIRKLMISN